MENKSDHWLLPDSSRTNHSNFTSDVMIGDDLELFNNCSVIVRPFLGTSLVSSAGVATVVSLYNVESNNEAWRFPRQPHTCCPYAFNWQQDVGRHSLHLSNILSPSNMVDWNTKICITSQLTHVDTIYSLLPQKEVSGWGLSMDLQSSIRKREAQQVIASADFPPVLSLQVLASVGDDGLVQLWTRY
jgi:hypothetical protein